jgi:hypothetical protein
MVLGHYGAAFVAKRYAPRTSLGMFNLATQFLDELWRRARWGCGSSHHGGGGSIAIAR